MGFPRVQEWEIDAWEKRWLEMIEENPDEIPYQRVKRLAAEQNRAIDSIKRHLSARGHQVRQSRIPTEKKHSRFDGQPGTRWKISSNPHEKDYHPKNPVVYEGFMQGKHIFHYPDNPSSKVSYAPFQMTDIMLEPA